MIITTLVDITPRNIHVFTVTASAVIAIVILFIDKHIDNQAKM